MLIYVILSACILQIVATTTLFAIEEERSKGRDFDWNRRLVLVVFVRRRSWDAAEEVVCQLKSRTFNLN